MEFYYFKENRRKIGLIIAFTALMVGIYVFYPNHSPARLSRPSMAMVQGNSLIAISSPTQPEYRVYGSLVSDIVECESGGKQTARGKAGEIGIAQFMPATFEWMKGLANFEGSIDNKEDQLYLLNWALENGYKGHWSCVKLLGL